MAKDQLSLFSFRFCCSILVSLSSFSYIFFLYVFYCSECCNFQIPNQIHKINETINLPTYPLAWNHLSFSLKPPPASLKIALFVKKWPDDHHAGGMERHALTLYHVLAKRGHQIHVFTPSIPNSSLSNTQTTNTIFHLSSPAPWGGLDQALAWKQFQEENSTGRPFDVIHTESVGLHHTNSHNQPNLAVSWHGIAYETIHSDIIQELVRPPNVPRSSLLTEQVLKVVEEVKFFPSYAHHVATSDHVGDILKRIYMIPDDRVHIILNGVDEEVFRADAKIGRDFKSKFGIPESKSLILGMSGRLVKDKGHPLMFEVLQQIFRENTTFRDNIMLVVAGDGPWGSKYKELGSNIHVLGPLERPQLASFYNAIDIFVHPTFRAQGFDQTLLEAFLTGKPLMATKLASITDSVIINKDYGYTFSPTVSSLKKALYEVYEDGREILEKKGRKARERSLKLFTATKMAAAYERLFLCISKDGKYSDSCKFQPQIG